MNVNDNVEQVPKCPTPEEVRALVGAVKAALAEFQKKILVEKRMTTEDVTAHCSAMTDGFTSLAQLHERFGKVFRCEAGENARLRKQISALISGGRGTK